MEGSSSPHDHEDTGVGSNAFLQHITSLIDVAMARNLATFERIVDDKISHLNNNNNNNNHGGRGKTNGGTDGDSSHGKTDRVSFKSFKGCGAVEFTGLEETDMAIAAYTWVENTEKVFNISHCWEEDQVGYATAMLTKDALHWWNARKVSLGEEKIKTMSWAEFKVEFMKQYCPKDQQDKYEREFINLQQGSMTVTAYEAEFNRKSRFATQMLTSEDVKVRRFMQGLRWEIRESVQMQSPLTLADVTRYARMREDILKAKDTDLMPPPKRTHTDIQASSFLSGRSAASGRSFSRNQSQSNARLCNRCGRRHFRPCKAGRSFSGAGSRAASSAPLVCYRCGKVGHTMLNCPERTIGLICYECGVPGHMRRECPKLKPAGSVVSASPSVAIPVQSKKEDTSRARPRAFQITAKEAR